MQIPMLMSQTVITQTCCSAAHEITCHLFIHAAPGATRRNQNETSKLQVTLLVQKGVATRSHPIIHYDLNEENICSETCI